MAVPFAVWRHTLKAVISVIARDKDERHGYASERHITRYDEYCYRRLSVNRPYGIINVVIEGVGRLSLLRTSPPLLLSLRWRIGLINTRAATAERGCVVMVVIGCRLLLALLPAGQY